MTEASLLRSLADRLDELESLKLFPADLSDPGTVTVEWTAGCDHPGYAVLSQAISSMVEQHWGALRSQVVKKKEAEVTAIRKDWAEIGATPAAPEAPATDSLAAAMGPSRVQLVQRQA